ncbi:hypothetical protein MMM109_09830 [Helicobacter pylori]
MDNNKNNNKNAHLTHEIKKEHGGLTEASKELTYNQYLRHYGV